MHLRDSNILAIWLIPMMIDVNKWILYFNLWNSKNTINITSHALFNNDI
jgi:hypothetical protein